MSTTSANVIKGALGATGNAAIGTYISPGVFAAIFILFFMFIFFMVAFTALTSLQSPSFFPEKSPNWGSVEENE